jgi:hypothetical protein
VEQPLLLISLGMVINGSSTKLFEGVGLVVPRLGNVRLRLHFLRRGTISVIVICLTLLNCLPITAQPISSINESFEKFSFEVEKVGSVLSILPIIDHDLDTLGYWEQCVITNSLNEVLICDFALTGARHQILSFKLFNSFSLDLHRDSLEVGKSYNIDSPLRVKLFFDNNKFKFDKVLTLQSNYSDITKLYGRPDLEKNKANYKTLIYRYNPNLDSSNFTVFTQSYYKFLFYNGRLIEVVITFGDV